jgi:hypothetical protein
VAGGGVGKGQGRGEGGRRGWRLLRGFTQLLEEPCVAHLVPPPPQGSHGEVDSGGPLPEGMWKEDFFLFAIVSCIGSAILQ